MATKKKVDRTLYYALVQARATLLSEVNGRPAPWIPGTVFETNMQLRDVLLSFIEGEIDREDRESNGEEMHMLRVSAPREHA